MSKKWAQAAPCSLRPLQYGIDISWFSRYHQTQNLWVVPRETLCYNRTIKETCGEIMAKKMKFIAMLSLLATLGCAALYAGTENGAVLSLSITFGTIAYHFWMRLAVGWVYDHTLHNHGNYRRKWFQVSMAEQRLYQKLKVRRWKNKMPTYDASAFDRSIHSWDEIAQAMCQSELVHETIMVLSFVPIIAYRWFGALPVFVVTSVLAAAFDGLFVIMQRYNRPRILKMVNRESR